MTTIAYQHGEHLLKVIGVLSVWQDTSDPDATCFPCDKTWGLLGAGLNPLATDLIPS